MFPRQLFTQWLIVSVDSNILDFYSVDHKKPKFGKKNKVKMIHLISVTIGLHLWGCLTKQNWGRCSVASQCKDAHLFFFLLMFIFFWLQSCLGIVTITLHMHFLFFFGKKFKTCFFPQNLLHPIPSSSIFHSWMQGNKSFIELLPFHHWNVKVYQQEQYLQIQREPAVYWLPLLYF